MPCYCRCVMCGIVSPCLVHEDENAVTVCTFLVCSLHDFASSFVLFLLEVRRAAMATCTVLMSCKSDWAIPEVYGKKKLT